VRKSQPEISIGSCTVIYKDNDIVICPHRFLERKQIFTDCLHLLTLHQPGNEFHLIPETRVPGGSIDYFLVSASGKKVEDFVGIEIQTLDTSSGTVWPERQRFLKAHGLRTNPKDTKSPKTFGMNWKMNAKTILMQLHHKIETFEKIGRHLVLAVQDHFLNYMRGEFSFGHLSDARLGDPMHIHAYSVARPAFRLELAERLSTNAKGIADCLGLLAAQDLPIEEIIRKLEKKLSRNTLLSISPAECPSFPPRVS
jgi:hypothetical protein